MSIQIARLGDVAETTSGGTPQRGVARFYGGGIPWVKSGELPDGLIIGTEESITEEGLANSSTKLLPSGTLLIAMYGATVGKLGILGMPATTNQAVCAITPRDELDRDYLFHWLLKIRSSLVEASFGGAQPNISQAFVRDIELPLPELDEQRRIAARLKAQLAAVEEARQAAQAQAKEVEALTRRIHEQSLEALEDAQRVTLGELLLGIEAGKSFQTSERLAGEHELGVLKVSAVSWTEFRADQAKAIDGNYIPDDRHFVRQGDLLISRANTVELVGAVAKVERDYPNRLLSDKTLRLVLDESRIHPDYLIQVLRMPEAREHIEGNATGTSDSMRNISQGTLRAIPVPFPPMVEQVRIATRLSEADAASKLLRQAIQAQLREIELLPARLLAQAFENPV
ncbi:MAG: restriction endonuclease subunit S [Acidobacteriota bacterium]